MNKLIGNNDDKKYEIGNFSEELNQRAGKIEVRKEKKNIENKVNLNYAKSGELRFVTDEKMFNEFMNFLGVNYHLFNSFMKDKLSFDKEKNVMTGSNPYIAIAMDHFLETDNSEYRIARQIDLEGNLGFAQGYYVDIGLGLKCLEINNNNQQSGIFFDLAEKGIEKKDYPIWVDLRGLKLNEICEIGLTNESVYSSQEFLNWKRGSSYLEKNEFGLPKSQINSNRFVYTSEKRFCRGIIDQELNLQVNLVDFHSSNHMGRIVLARVKEEKETNYNYNSGPGGSGSIT